MITTEKLMDVLVAGSEYNSRLTWWALITPSGGFVSEKDLPEGTVEVQPEKDVKWSESGLGFARTGSYVVFRETSFDSFQLF